MLSVRFQSTAYERLLFFIVLSLICQAYLCYVMYFSDDGVYVGVGMITGSVAVYIAFSLQVNSLCTLKSVLSDHLK